MHLKRTRITYIILSLCVCVFSASEIEEDFEDIFDEVDDVGGMDIEANAKQISLFNMWNEPVIHLNGATFGYFVLTEPRAYDTYVLVVPPNCIRCQVVDQFDVAATSYKEFLTQRRMLRQAPLFFVQVNATDVFQEQTNALPSIILYPRTHHPEFFKAQRTKVLPEKYSIQDVSEFLAKDIAYMVQQKSKVSIPVLNKEETDLMMKMSWLMFLFIAVSKFISNYDYIMNNKNFWMYTSVFIYAVSTSGVISCIIRGAVPFYLDEKGNFMLLHPQRNQQFLLEGLIAAGLNIGCAWCIFTILTHYAKLRDKEERQQGILNMCVGFAILYLSLVTMFKMKSRWYFR